MSGKILSFRFLPLRILLYSITLPFLIDKIQKKTAKNIHQRSKESYKTHSLTAYN